MNCRFLTLIMLFWMVLVAWGVGLEVTCLGVSYYVDGKAGNDDWSGLSPIPGDPNGPKATIQAGIDAASDADEVIVADAVYMGQGNKDLDFSHNGRDPYRGILIRSANGPDKCIIDCEEEGRGFNFHSGESPEAVVDGFTIQNGKGYVEYVGDHPWLTGGAIRCVESSPTVINCVFQNSMVNIGHGAGGGVFCGDGAAMTLIDCVMRNNFVGCDITGGGGGGIYCGGVDSSVTVIRCHFSGNKAMYAGGAILLKGQDSEAILANCTIEGNTAGEGGGVCVWEGASAELVNCTLSGNTAVLFGGAIRCHTGDVDVENCILWGNFAGGDPEEISVDGDSVVDGTISVSWSLVAGGCEGVSQGSNGQLNWGDGNIDGDPCFAVSGSYEESQWAAGDYHLQSEIGRWDSNFYRSRELAGNDDVVNLRDFAEFCLSWGVVGDDLAADFDRDGMVNVSDLCMLALDFMGPSVARGRWLCDSVTSICIDVGREDTDWTGELWPHGKRINMGAYGGTANAGCSLSEAGSPADIDRDGTVDSKDFMAMADFWLVREYLLTADMNRDGAVDLRDWVWLVEQWGWVDSD